MAVMDSWCDKDDKTWKVRKELIRKNKIGKKIKIEEEEMR